MKRIIIFYTFIICLTSSSYANPAYTDIDKKIKEKISTASTFLWLIEDKNCKNAKDSVCKTYAIFFLDALKSVKELYPQWKYNSKKVCLDVTPNTKFKNISNSRWRNIISIKTGIPISAMCK